MRAQGPVPYGVNRVRKMIIAEKREMLCKCILVNFKLLDCESWLGKEGKLSRYRKGTERTVWKLGFGGSLQGHVGCQSPKSVFNTTPTRDVV